MTAADAAAVLLDELLPPEAGAAQLVVALGELRRRTDCVRGKSPPPPPSDSSAQAQRALFAAVAAHYGSAEGEAGHEAACDEALRSLRVEGARWADATELPALAAAHAASRAACAAARAAAALRHARERVLALEAELPRLAERERLPDAAVLACAARDAAATLRDEGEAASLASRADDACKACADGLCAALGGAVRGAPGGAQVQASPEALQRLWRSAAALGCVPSCAEAAAASVEQALLAPLLAATPCPSQPPLQLAEEPHELSWQSSRAACCADECARCSEWGGDALVHSAAALCWLQARLAPAGEAVEARAALCAALAPRLRAALAREAERRPAPASPPAEAAKAAAARLRSAGLADLLPESGDGGALLAALAAGCAAHEHVELGAALAAAREAAARDTSAAEPREPPRAPQAQDGPLPAGALELLAALEAAPPHRRRAAAAAALCYAACAAPSPGGAPAAAMLFHNAALALARLCAEEAALGASAALRCAGAGALAAAAAAQADEALGALQGAAGFRDAAPRAAAAGSALRGALHVCLRWAALCGELLPAHAAAQAAAAPLEAACAAAVGAVLQLPDVGAEDCTALAALLSGTLREAEARGADAGEWWRTAAALSPAWRRLGALALLLEAPLVSLSDQERWGHAFTAAELAHFARSLFEDSSTRRGVIAELTG